MKSLVAIFLLFGLVSCASKPGSGDQQAKQTEKTEKKDSTSAAASDAVPNVVTCTLGKDVRTIGVKKEGAGCQTVYTKFGKERTPASDASGTDHCDTVAKNIVSNLTSGGFKCK